MGGNGLTADGFDQKGAFPAILIFVGYQVHEAARIIGMPDWCKTDAYDLHAKVTEADMAAWKKQPDLPGALRALLEDRFQMKSHFEVRDAPAYALVVAKGGPKFKAAIPDETYPDGFHDRQGKPVSGLRDTYDAGSDHGHLIGQAATMANLAQYLSVRAGLGRVVVDQTGLTGQYDFSLPVLASWGTNREPDDSEASVFTVIQDSLGLKLEPIKAPTKFLVIDHIERPSEN